MTLIRYIKQLLGSGTSQSTKRALAVDPQFVIKRQDHCLSQADLSNNAVKVLSRLQKANFAAFLVGGSVRDLLLKQTPKDFDIATNAKPEQIKKQFRNCRLIGRRFRLAHILFGREIIEVATFRAALSEKASAKQQEMHGMIVRDNSYGSLEEDAWRRDFTVNALYYNLADGSVIDYTGGYADLQQQQLRIIGDASARYREDPVRMLRAVRFAAKLNFRLEQNTAEEINNCRDQLQHVSNARLFEEILKLFHSGYAKQTLALLNEYQLLSLLFPALEPFLDQKKITSLLQTTLNNTDLRIQQGKPVTPAFLIAAFLWHPLQQHIKAARKQKQAPLEALEQSMNEILSAQHKITSIPRRFSNVVREIWLLQYRLPKRRGKRAFRTLSHPRFRAAYDLLVLRGQTGDAPVELANWWEEFQFASSEQRTEMVENL